MASGCEAGQLLQIPEVDDWQPPRGVPTGNEYFQNLDLQLAKQGDCIAP